jgi:hypothetical protein
MISMNIYEQRWYLAVFQINVIFLKIITYKGGLNLSEKPSIDSMSIYLK